jgi:hypothetical protein
MISNLKRETDSSYFLQDLSVSQKTRINTDQLKQLQQDGLQMLEARQKIHVLWTDLRKTDVYSHGMVQFNQFLHIFEKNK